MKEAIWSWAFLCGKFLFLMTKSISLVVIGLFRLSVSSWVSLIVCVFLGICSFNLSYLIFWCMAMHRVLFNSSYLCKFDSNVSSFIPDFSNLSFLTLFSIILAKGLSFFFFFRSFQRTDFWFYCFPPEIQANRTASIWNISGSSGRRKMENVANHVLTLHISAWDRHTSISPIFQQPK